MSEPMSDDELDRLHDLPFDVILDEDDQVIDSPSLEEMLGSDSP